MALATQRDVEVSMLRPLTETEALYASDLLDRAERLLRARIPDLLERVNTDLLRADLVADIEAEMLARVFRADGNHFIQEAEGNYSYRLNLQVASGLLKVSDDEWARLGLGAGWGEVTPETDGYATSRGYGVIPPHLRFQYGWGGGDQMAETWPVIGQ